MNVDAHKLMAKHRPKPEGNEEGGIFNNAVITWTVGQAIEWKDETEWKDGVVVSVDDGAGLICVEVDGDTMFVDSEDAPEELRVKGGELCKLGTVACQEDKLGTDSCKKDPVAQRLAKRTTHRRANGEQFYTFEGDDEPEKTGQEGDENSGKEFVAIFGAGEWEKIPQKRTTYQVVKADGSGKPVQRRFTVTLHAKAWFKATGKCFWDTRKIGGVFEYKAGDDQVIKGFDDGIRGMKAGEIRKLDIPAIAAYGTKGYGPWDVPPNAHLLFEIEILFVRRGFA
jgi:FKBP-type peptidyl-prolyl cis-trans isomerase